MKLIRYGAPGEEKPAIMSDGKYYDASSQVQDYDEAFFSDPAYLRQLEKVFESEALPEIRPERIGPPVKRPGKIICVGLNYRKHAEESGMDVPSEPVLFGKATSSICGPFDEVIIPKNSVKTDWEVELAVVIGRKASYVSEADAMNHVVGYTLHNDISEREFQLEKAGQWIKGKSADTFAPLGPFLATTDEIADPHSLRLWLKVNDEMLQDSNTNDLVFDIPHLVSYISHFMTLMPGDIISTGTPAGVGLGLKPPRFLQPGDTMELGIDGLGVARQTAKAYNP